MTHIHRRRRTLARTLVVLGAFATLTACPKNARTPNPEYAARTAQYRRLAIACAPAPGAEPAQCGPIMDEVAGMAPSRLDFLEKVDLLRNLAVDTSTRPPTVRLKDVSTYDGVVVLVYSVPGPVVLDLDLLDAKTGAAVWHHELSTDDKDVHARLRRHGFWTPTTIKQQFYGR